MTDDKKPKEWWINGNSAIEVKDGQAGFGSLAIERSAYDRLKAQLNDAAHGAGDWKLVCDDLKERLDIAATSMQKAVDWLKPFEQFVIEPAIVDLEHALAKIGNTNE